MVPCLVLNATEHPLAVVPALRALRLVMEGRANIKEEHPTKKFHSVSLEFPVPTTIVLKTYRQTGAGYHGPAQLNQRNLFVRDNYRCAYCGRHVMELNYDEKKGALEYLTRDHVVPLSRQGEDTWTNVVTACSTCNHTKDDNTPEQILEHVMYYEQRVVDLSMLMEADAGGGPDSGEESDSADVRRELADSARLLKLWQGLMRSVSPREATVFEILQKRQKRLSQERAA